MAKTALSNNTALQPHSSLSAVALAVALACQASQAATLTVTDAGDAFISDSVGGTCTMREAAIVINQQNTTVTIDNVDFVTGCTNTGGPFGNSDTIAFGIPAITTRFGPTGAVFLRDVSLNPNGSNVTWSADNVSRHLTSFATSNGNPNVTISNMTLQNGFYSAVPDVSSGYGSSIRVFDGNVTIDNCTIQNNTAAVSAAILVSSAQNNASLVVNDSSIINNTSQNTTDGNNFGGGILISSNADATISDSIISGNTADRGAGIAIVGAGSQGGQVSINNSTIENNVASNYGGGITTLSTAARAVNLSITDTTIATNMADVTGGGLRITNVADGLPTNVVLENSTVAANSAANTGGIDLGNGNLRIENSTISGNLADTHGGIATYANSRLTMLNSTVAFNSADLVGGLNILGMSNVTIRNSILSNSTGSSAINGNCVANMLTATVSGDSNSIIGNNLSCGFGRDVNPQLSALADNGGATQTHYFNRFGPVESSGNPDNCLSTDQRGEARNSGQSLIVPISIGNNRVAVIDLGGGDCDVGAVEAPPPPAG